MKKHRFIGDFDLTKNEVEIANSEQVRQIRTVLRLEMGEKIILSDGKGAEAEGTLTSLSKSKVTVKIQRVEKVGEKSRIVNLYLAILKKENFELAVQKAVECGVGTITPIITDRTIKTGLNIERLQKIIFETCEQSGRSMAPDLFETFPFEEAINSQAEHKIIFHLGEGVKDFNPDTKAQTVNIFVGPEGGFTDKEIMLAQEHGYIPASLGPLTLRGETAAIVATYRAVYGV